MAYKKKRVIVVGASAGGVEALLSLVKRLPADLPAPVGIVLHTPPQGSSRLPEILARAGRLPALHPADGDPLRPGRIYVAPPDRHMTFGEDSVKITHGPRENGFRPAVDPLFRSAASHFDSGAIGVILSGGMTDGAVGLRNIKQSGGFAIVQDPNEAPFQGMPTSALELGPVDFTLPAAEIGDAIQRLVKVRRGPGTASPAATVLPAAFPGAGHGNPSPYTCPECHGLLWEVGADGPHFRCRVGHSYSVASLLDEQQGGIESSLYASLRALEESGSLARRLAEDARSAGKPLAAKRFQADASQSEKHAAVLRGLLNKDERQRRQIALKARNRSNSHRANVG